MSVQLFDQKQINDLLRMLKYHEDHLLTALNYSRDFSHYLVWGHNDIWVSCHETISPDKIAEKKTQFLNRLIWYAVVANKIAYSLQYRENIELFDINVDYDAIEPKICTKQDLRDALEHLSYNFCTNDGNIFLEDKWYKPFCLLEESF